MPLNGDISRINFQSGKVSLSPPPDVAPDEAREAALQAVRDAVQAGEFDRAGVLAERALRGGFEHSLLLNLYAMSLENAGRLDEAAACLRRAAELAPADIHILNALGQCLSGLERPEEALEPFDRALAVEPQFTDAHVNRGAALEAMGRLKPAEESYRRALKLQPRHLGALVGLASIAIRYGEHQEARRLAEAVLRAEPNHPAAVVGVAAADLADGRLTEAEARLRMLLDDPRPSPVQKSGAASLLGDVLDAQGRTQEAFDCYSRVGDDLRRFYAARFEGEASALHASRWMGAYFEAASPGAWGPSRAIPADHAGAREHVFLLGFPRSGTTLLEQALAGHPQVEALSEAETLIDGVQTFMWRPSGLDRLAGATEAELRPFREAYWRRAHEAGARPRGKVFVDKHPLNTLKLPLIVRLFPQAKILFARRDPRDVVLSCFRRRFRISAPTFEMLTLEGSAALYDATMRLAVRLNELTRLDLCAVSHERLVEDFDGEMGRIWAFLRLDPAGAPRAFDSRVRERAIATPSAAQLARGLNAEGVGQWRRYEAQMRPVLPVLEPWVRRFGYDATVAETAAPSEADFRALPRAVRPARQSDLA